METTVKMQITLVIEHDGSKTLEDVQGAAYWLLEPFLDEAKTDTYKVNGCQVKKFNIEMEG